MDVPTRRKRIFGIRKPYDALFTFKVLKKAQITTPLHQAIELSFKAL